MFIKIYQAPTKLAFLILSVKLSLEFYYRRGKRCALYEQLIFRLKVTETFADD